MRRTLKINIIIIPTEYTSLDERNRKREKTGSVFEPGNDIYDDRIKRETN